MTPSYALWINGSDITPVLQNRVVSINLSDTAGFNNDKLTIVVEAEPPIAIPKRGAKATLFLGYKKQPGSASYEGLENMGLFEFDESEMQKSKGGGRTVTFHFHALATGGMFKETQKREYEGGYSLGEIVEYVASSNNLEAVVDPSFYSVEIPYLAQDASDQSFLTSLGLRYGANFKISGEQLIFARVGTIQSLADTIVEEQCEAYSWLNQSTSNWGSVVTNTYDPDTKKYTYKVKPVRTNQDEAQREENARQVLPMLYPSEAEAQAAADGRAAALEAQGHTFSFELKEGNPKLKAEMNIKAQGFYDVNEGVQMPTDWHLTKVTHVYIKNRGYKTSGVCDKPIGPLASLDPNATPEEQAAASEAAKQAKDELKAAAEKKRKDELQRKKQLQKQL